MSNKNEHIITNLQSEIQSIHAKYGTSELANYKLQLLCESYAKQYHNELIELLNKTKATGVYLCLTCAKTCNMAQAGNCPAYVDSKVRPEFDCMTCNYNDTCGWAKTGFVCYKHPIYIKSKQISEFETETCYQCNQIDSCAFAHNDIRCASYAINKINHDNVAEDYG